MPALPEKSDSKSQPAVISTPDDLQPDPAVDLNALISVVIPLKNEEGSLKELFNRIYTVFGSIGRKFEVVFIDDGSDDESFNILEALYTDFPKNIRVLQFRRNMGKAEALSAGFGFAAGEIIITMDADLQDDPEEIPRFLEALASGSDLVSGWKKVRHDPWHKVIPSRFFNWVVSKSAGLRLHDYNCGFKAYRREVLDEITLYGDLHRYIPFLANSKGFRVSEIVVRHHPRKAGRSKYGFARYFKGFFDLLTVIMLTRFASRPMHLFGVVGLVLLVLGFILNVHLTLQWFAGFPIGNRPLLVLGVLLMMVGLQTFSVGLIGEMINSNRGRDSRDVPVKKILK
ncbi:MAG TPA: glycosyltransferase family 2 protein [bacterium]|jgi:glycosyltransferase involved in cell wall biosynthesis